MSNLAFNSAAKAFNPNIVHPVLARLYSSHGILKDNITQLAHGERAGLCDDVTQLIRMSERPSDREIASDILIALLTHAEKNLKCAIAERFALIDSAPLRLILQFVNDDIEVAAPVLKYSKALNDLDLMYIIQSRDAPFWQAIATRKDLTENVVETLVDTKDELTVQKLVDNKTALFSDYAVSQIAKLANNNPELGEALLCRSQGADADFVRQIYLYASESLKAEILKKCGTLATEAASELQDVLQEFTNVRTHGFLPSPSMLRAAELFHEQGKLTVALMVNTLKRGQMASFIAQFSKFIDLPVAVVVPMLQQKNGQGLSIAAKANGIGRNDFLMMFNSTRKMMGEQYLSSDDVATALGYYDRVSSDVAKRLMRRKLN